MSVLGQLEAGIGSKGKFQVQAMDIYFVGFSRYVGSGVRGVTAYCDRHKSHYHNVLKPHTVLLGS